MNTVCLTCREMIKRWNFYLTLFDHMTLPEISRETQLVLKNVAPCDYLLSYESHGTYVINEMD